MSTEEEDSIVKISVNSRTDLVILVFAVFVLWALISLWTTYIEFIIFEKCGLDKNNILAYTIILLVLSFVFIVALLHTGKGHIVGHGNGSLD